MEKEEGYHWGAGEDCGVQFGEDVYFEEGGEEGLMFWSEGG